MNQRLFAYFFNISNIEHGYHQWFKYVSLLGPRFTQFASDQDLSTNLASKTWRFRRAERWEKAPSWGRLRWFPNWCFRPWSDPQWPKRQSCKTTSFSIVQDPANSDYSSTQSKMNWWNILTQHPASSEQVEGKLRPPPLWGTRLKSRPSLVSWWVLLSPSLGQPERSSLKREMI